jgi:hypothetical protein
MKTPIFDSSIKNNVKELQKYEGKTVKVLVTDTFGFSQSITGIFSFRNSSSFLIYSNRHMFNYSDYEEYDLSFKYRTHYKFLYKKAALALQDRKLQVFPTQKTANFAKTNDSYMIDIIRKQSLCNEGIMYILENFLPKKLQKLTPIQALELIKKKSKNNIPPFVEEYLCEHLLKY